MFTKEWGSGKSEGEWNVSLQRVDGRLSPSREEYTCRLIAAKGRLLPFVCKRFSRGESDR